MTRIITAGAELRTIGTAVSTTGLFSLDGSGSGTVAPVIDTTTVIGGSASYRCDGTASATSYMFFSFWNTILSAVRFYVRTRVRVSAYPVTAVPILEPVNSVNSTVNFCQVRMNGSGQIGLFDAAGTTQYGSYSTAVALDTAVRIDLVLFSGTGTGHVDLYVDGTLSASSPSTLNIALNQGWRCGWIAAPGQTASLWVDDVALNNETSAYENTSPPPNAHIYKTYPNRVISNTSNQWLSSKGASSAAADLIDALDNFPPLGKAHTTTDTVNSQVYNVTNPAAGSPSSLVLECQSLGRIGIFGNVFCDTLSSTYLPLGSTSSNAQCAQRLYLQPTLLSVTFWIRKVGSPTDAVQLAIQADSSGPSGTDLAVAAVDGATLATTDAAIAFTSLDVPFTQGTPYYLVLRRMGALDPSNYYEIRTSTTAYWDGGTRVNSGTWGTLDQTTNLAFRAYSSVGNAVINTMYVTVCTGESGAGTKTGTVALTNPTIASTSYNFGLDAGAAGTYPGNNWGWTVSSLITNVSIPSMAVAPQITLAKTNSSANPAMCCCAAVIFEATDPQQGWVAYTRNSDSASVYAKYPGTTATLTQDDGTVVSVPSGSWAAVLNSDMPIAETSDFLTITVVDDATFRSGYTPV